MHLSIDKWCPESSWSSFGRRDTGGIVHACGLRLHQYICEILLNHSRNLRKKPEDNFVTFQENKMFNLLPSLDEYTSGGIGMK
jgi:hypothetical protein